MKRLILVTLLITGLFLQACTVEDIYSELNDRWGLDLPKAVTIIEGASDTTAKLTSSTKNINYIFQYQETDKSKIEGLDLWEHLTTREINLLVQQIFPQLYPSESTPRTPAERLSLVEDALGFKLDEHLNYFSKRDKLTPTGGRIVLLYDPDSVQIQAFHFVE